MGVSLGTSESTKLTLFQRRDESKGKGKGQVRLGVFLEVRPRCPRRPQTLHPKGVVKEEPPRPPWFVRELLHRKSSRPRPDLEDDCNEVLVPKTQLHVQRFVPGTQTSPSSRGPDRDLHGDLSVTLPGRRVPVVGPRVRDRESDPCLPVVPHRHPCPAPLAIRTPKVVVEMVLESP